MMKQRLNIPEDPTRPMRRLAIQESIARVAAIIRSAGHSNPSAAEIAEQAHLRVERAKTVGSVEHSGAKAKRAETE